MDQHEKDWLDLGRQLKNYHPQGRPDEDFKAFRELQKQEAGPKTGALAPWLSFNLLLLLLPLLGVIAFSLSRGQGDGQNPAGTERKLAEVTVVAQTPPDELNTATEDQFPGREETAGVTGQSSPPDLVFPAIREGQAGLKGDFVLPVQRSAADAKSREVRMAGTGPEAALPGPAPLPTALLPDHLPQHSGVTVQPLLTEPISPVSAPALPVPAPGAIISPQSSIIQITLGAGLSNHWRGASFMQEVDRGIYAYVGINRRIGRRLGLEGRIGYRGHGMQMPVFSDVDAPWSYHKEEIHNTGHMGEDREYIYEGVVEGYQAVEFSLLANYQLTSRLNINAGMRYSLPDLAFERTVVGPDDENPFFEFIEGRSLVKYQDYGALFGAEYHFNRHLAIEAGLHLGMVDLIDDAAAGSTRFNHSSSLSFGVKYKLE